MCSIAILKLASKTLENVQQMCCTVKIYLLLDKEFEKATELLLFLCCVD